MRDGKRPAKKRKAEAYENESKAVLVTYFVLRIAVIFALVSSLLRGDYESVFTCVLVLVLYMLPSILEKSARIELPSVLEIVILCFIFAAEVLGELQSYYIQYKHWDTLLHAVNGFVASAFGFALVDVLNRHERFSMKLQPIYMSIVAFCFSMTVGVLWEFFEFGVDYIFHMDMQKDTIISTIKTVMLDETNSNKVIIIDGITDVAVNGRSLGLGGYLDIGLYDTMEDLLVNFVGAVVFCIIGFFYFKGDGKGKIAKMFIPKVKAATEKKTYITDGDDAADE